MNVNKLVNTFNKEILDLIKFTKKKEKDNIDIEWLHKIICTIKNENPAFIIEKCIDKLWDNKENIINRSEDFFKDNFEKKWIKDDCRKEWLSSFVAHIKNNMFILNPNEKIFVWDQVNKMLELVIEYRIMKGYHK